MHNRIDNRWLCLELSTMEYTEAWNLQNRLVAARRHGAVQTNVILLLEHFRVFTLGRRGGLNNVTVPEDVLEKAGIPVIQVERGGNITFHGPGQLVMYPIIDLQGAGIGVVDYVTRLEEVMIRTAQDWDITAERNSLNRGVWVGNSKLGSVGIAVRRGICFHGAALNVNLSLKPFEWISPCGLQDVQVTSLEQELSCRVSMQDVRKTVKQHFETIFGTELVMTSLLQLQRVLATDPHPGEICFAFHRASRLTQTIHWATSPSGLSQLLPRSGIHSCNT